MSTATEKANQHYREVRRVWDGVPVRDAKTDLRLFTCQGDIDCAVQRDPGRCIFARACERIVGAKKILFFKRHAYVELADDAGKPVVERFEITAKMASAIAAFDRGKGVPPKVGYVLKAPTASRTLEKMRKMSREVYARRKAGPERTKHTKRRSYLIDLTVRNGTGQSRRSISTKKAR